MGLQQPDATPTMQLPELLHRYQSHHEVAMQSLDNSLKVRLAYVKVYQGLRNAAAQLPDTAWRTWVCFFAVHALPSMSSNPSRCCIGLARLRSVHVLRQLCKQASICAL